MALPPMFCSPREYFTTAVNFLKTHAWIYQHANTRCIESGVLGRFPDDWAEYFLRVSNEELNNFPLVYETELPELRSGTLKEFREKLKVLIPAEAFEEPQGLPAELYFQGKSFKGVKQKKQHEILRLATFISDECGEGELLIDFGSGLGYLSEFLYSLNSKFRILCLEADAYRVETARKRLPAGAGKSIRHVQEFINEDSRGFILANVSELAPEETPLSIIGLHACADLSITSIKHFLSINRVKRLIIMPCCYHKLQMSTKTEFVNFPLSLILKKAVAEDAEYSSYFNRPFLRLACQQTTARWSSCTADEHVQHGEGMFMRALAEAVIDKASEVVAKRRHQMNFVDNATGRFDSLIHCYELRSKITEESMVWNERHLDKCQEIAGKYDVGHKLVEGLSCLQTAMQKLCENIVLYDRLCFMEECASELGLHIRVRYQKLLNEQVSPRCYVLIAEKL